MASRLERFERRLQGGGAKLPAQVTAAQRHLLLLKSGNFALPPPDDDLELASDRGSRATTSPLALEGGEDGEGGEGGAGRGEGGNNDGGGRVGGKDDDGGDDDGGGKDEDCGGKDDGGGAKLAHSRWELAAKVMEAEGVPFWT